MNGSVFRASPVHSEKLIILATNNLPRLDYEICAFARLWWWLDDWTGMNYSPVIEVCLSLEPPPWKWGNKNFIRQNIYRNLMQLIIHQNKNWSLFIVYSKWSRKGGIPDIIWTHKIAHPNSSFYRILLKFSGNDKLHVSPNCHYSLNSISIPNLV